MTFFEGKIKKRNGKIVPFDGEKVFQAIFKSARAVGGSDAQKARALADKVVNFIRQTKSGQIPDVEEIQDIVEKILIEEGHAKTAKAYILYREKHKNLRETEKTFLEIQKITDEYLSRASWRTNENSNTDYSFSGLMLHISGKVIANYTLNKFYSTRARDAHVKGYMHIHDLSMGIIGYCAGWSLKKLIMEGFGGVPKKIEAAPAKHLDVLISQMVNFIGTMQMEFAGAQAFSSVDTYLAPFVHADKLNYKQVKQTMQRLVYSLNVPSRWGSQAPFSNLTFDIKCPDDLKNEPAVVGGEFLKETYGEFQKEMDMINKAFLEIMSKGDATGRIFTFPIPTYNITKDFDWDTPFADLLFKVTAKYGTPYFQNYAGSNLNPNSIRAMCCRLNLNLDELQKRPGGMWAMGDSTGSIGVVTINLNRIAYETANRDEFFGQLKYFMDLAKDSLEEKRRILNKNIKTGLVPYTERYLGHFNNHFSTIGLCGMNEACVNLIGKNILSEEGKELTLETLAFMNKVIVDYQKETGNLYNLEATPAESTAFRFAKLDKEIYPDIYVQGENGNYYLTNSTQINVAETDDLFETLEHQSDIQSKYTGGTMFHTFVGEELEERAAKTLVKKIAFNTKLPYFSITPTFSVCRDHGYIKGEHFECPECGKEAEVYSRIVGYYRPVQNWNKGKKEEFKNRKCFEVPPADGSATASQNTEEKETAGADTPNRISTANIKSYRLFTSPSCPNCAPLKKFLKEHFIMEGEEINAFDNMPKTRKLGVMSTPTVIFYDNENKEVSRAANLSDLNEIEKLYKA